MHTIIRKAACRIQSLVGPDHVVYKNTILPAPHLRFCGPEFSDHEYFLTSAQAEAQRLINHLSLGQDTRILDVGCGMGRLAIGIIRQMGAVKNYQGIDVSKKAIRWCQRFITAQQPNFQFTHVDVKNSRYNPHGTALETTFRLPFEDRSFDIIYLYSVFSHMNLEDACIYLQEFRRLLKGSGKIFLTTFIETGVPDFTVNPKGYRSKNWHGPLHCVRYNKDFFTSLLAEFDFHIDRFDYEKEANGQSGVMISRQK